MHSLSCTKERLIEDGYTIIQDEEETEEMTVSQVCKELGRQIKIIK